MIEAYELLDPLRERAYWSLRTLYFDRREAEIRLQRQGLDLHGWEVRKVELESIPQASILIDGDVTGELFGTQRIKRTVRVLGFTGRGTPDSPTILRGEVTYKGGSLPVYLSYLPTRVGSGTWWIDQSRFPFKSNPNAGREEVPWRSTVS